MAKASGGMKKVADMKSWRQEQKEKKRRYQEALEKKQPLGTWSKTRPEAKAKAPSKKKAKKEAQPEAKSQSKKHEASEEPEVSETKPKKRKAAEASEEPEVSETKPKKRKAAEASEVPEVSETKPKKRKAAEASEEPEVSETKPKKGKAAEPDASEVEVKPKKKGKKGQTEMEADADTPAESQDPEAFKVVVAGLHFFLEEDAVRKHFSKCGEILSLRLLKDRETWKSRGIAFISFTSQASLEAALEYDGEEFRGRALLVQIAKGDAGKGKGKGNASGELSEKPKGCKSVILKGLAYSVTEADLKKLFKSCGDGPADVKILTNRETGASKGMAFLDFETASGVDEAIKLNGTVLKGRRFSMDYATPRT